jgi:S23 ribosomal protein.
MKTAQNGFRGMLVWQKNKALAVEVYRLTRHESIRRDFSLIDQLHRSAVSVPSNIAEGDERRSDRESIRSFHIAKGPLAELATQSEIAREVGCFNDTSVRSLLSECTEMGKMLGALIRARNSLLPGA